MGAYRPSTAIAAGDFVTTCGPHLLARHVSAMAAQVNVACLAAPAGPNVTTPAGRIGTPPGNVPAIFIAHDGPPPVTIRLHNTCYARSVAQRLLHNGGTPLHEAAPIRFRPPLLCLTSPIEAGRQKRRGARRGEADQKSRECCPVTTIPASAYARTVLSTIGVKFSTYVLILSSAKAVSGV